MWRLLLGCVVTLPVFAISAEPARAQLPIASADLRVESAAPSACPDRGFHFPGQAVHMTGDGFRPSATVQVYFQSQNTPRTRIATVNALSSGALDAVVTLPAAVSTGVLAGLEAEGAAPVGPPDALFVLSTLFKLVASDGPDSDANGIPDDCDIVDDDPED
jgi:hypothetical protein